MTQRDKDLQFLDALNREQAVEAADKAAQRAPTAEERQELARMKERLAESFRAHRAKVRDEAAVDTQARRKAAVPARILAMTRDAVLARLAELRALASPGMPVLAEARDHLGDTPMEELALSDLQWLLAAFEDELGEPSSES